MAEPNVQRDPAKKTHAATALPRLLLLVRREDKAVHETTEEYYNHQF